MNEPKTTMDLLSDAYVALATAAAAYEADTPGYSVMHEFYSFQLRRHLNTIAGALQDRREEAAKGAKS
ncbi:hypothetical protein [Caballeronia sp. ATUFL_M2_KS44]|uniref:hypothetical protein n=1 Tax=Caballeronia sp. ATUFL_M2_KS44 TaxID=2921767 RepID=UPI0020294128|nr:hypothetical protein [Caballeronia sp. ATUFL_M2_KS44]